MTDEVEVAARAIFRSLNAVTDGPEYYTGIPTEPYNEAARAALLSVNHEEIRRERDVYKAALEKIQARLVCSQGHGSEDEDVVCYCPNCDRSLHDARHIATDALAFSVREVLRAALQQQQEKGK